MEIAKKAAAPNQSEQTTLSTDGQKKTEEAESNPLAEPLFTEAEYEDAWANASYWARQRFIKKTTKTKWRRAYWSDGKAEAKAAGLPESAAVPGVRKMRLPPSDLHRYIKGFIETNRTKVEGENNA